MAVFRTRFLKGGVVVACFLCFVYLFLLNDTSIIRETNELTEDFRKNFLPSKDFIWKTSIEKTGFKYFHKIPQTSIMALYTYVSRAMPLSNVNL